MDQKNNIQKRLRRVLSYKIRMEHELIKAIELSNEAELFGIIVKLQKDLENSDHILEDMPYL